MRISFDLNDIADISRATAILAAIGLTLTGEPAAISSVPAVAQEATKVAKVVKAKRPDPVETYNAMAAAAGAPVVEVPTASASVPGEAVAAVEKRIVALEQSVTDELTFEQKCKAISDVVRKRAATGVMGMAETMALISWSAQDGMLRAMSPEKVDLIHGKAIAL